MTVLAPPVADDVRAPTSTRRARRPEIEGLRALAVGLVVVYHVFTGRVSGGVDVFLVLTGFFLVTTLGSRFATADGFNPVRPIARSLSRLAPVAFVVLAASVLASLWLAPRTRLREIVEHLVSSVTFTENLRLVQESADYAARTATTSPMQQFWSLSIQVQVLLAAPFLVAAVGLLLRAAGWSAYGRRTAVVLVAAATAASFAWALKAVRADQQAAYFSTLPRLWELGVGALAALVLAGRRPRGLLAAALGWLGVLGLVACGAVLDGAATFPGWQAGWPVLCAVVILSAGDAGGRFGAHRLLSVRPLQWLGLRSYGVYLWHWPLLVLYVMNSDGQRPRLVAGAVIIGAAVLLAEVTHRLVERPAGNLLRSRRPAWAVILVVLSAVPLLGAGAATSAQLDRQLADFVPSADDPRYPGARALLTADDAVAGSTDVEPVPRLSVIKADWARLPAGQCTGEDGDTTPGPVDTFECEVGTDDAARRIVLVGDSHAAHWLQPLAAITDAHDWQMRGLIHPGCALSTDSEFLDRDDPEFESCEEWRSGIFDRIIELDPDVVVTVGTRMDEDAGEMLPRGFVGAWEKLAYLGIPVIGLRDTPRHEFDVPDCVAEFGDTAPECAVEPSDVYDDDLLDTDLPRGVQLLDTKPYFCLPSVCPSLIGNVRVYLDESHVTNVYMHTVTPLLEPDLLARVPW